MLLVNLFNFLKGYIVISVEGYFLERFINICSRRHIYLWDIKKINSYIMQLKISINGFKSIRPVARKSKCNVRIVSKKGLPFLLHRYRKRKAFFIGILLFCGLILYMTSFIWVIEVSGIENIEKDEVISYLEHCGLKPGMVKFGIETDAIENTMMLKLSKLSWITIDIKGTKAIVSIKERTFPPKIIEKHIPCNIVSSRSGVIKTMTVKEGHPMVKEGDTVEKGQLLISGVMDDKMEEVRYVHSVASVKARTWYERSMNTELIREDRVKTGNKIKKYKFKLLDKKINLFLNTNISYINYDKMTYEKEFTFGSNYVFPIALEVNTFEEIEIEYKNIEIETAISETEKILAEQIKKDLSQDTEIIMLNTQHNNIDEHNILVTVSVESLEEIGIQDEILKE